MIDKVSIFTYNGSLCGEITDRGEDWVEFIRWSGHRMSIPITAIQYIEYLSDEEYDVRVEEAKEMDEERKKQFEIENKRYKEMKNRTTSMRSGFRGANQPDWMSEILESFENGGIDDSE